MSSKCPGHQLHTVSPMSCISWHSWWPKHSFGVQWGKGGEDNVVHNTLVLYKPADYREWWAVFLRVENSFYLLGFGRQSDMRTCIHTSACAHMRTRTHTLTGSQCSLLHCSLSSASSLWSGSFLTGVLGRGPGSPGITSCWAGGGQSLYIQWDYLYWFRIYYLEPKNRI